MARTVKCEACNGNGFHYHAYNIETQHESECTFSTWRILPETEAQARVLRQHYIRGTREICEVCDGVGEVEYEEDFDPYDYE